ncbi:RidA family protein [Streptomyces calidiresistens]|uniref:RidA family protein n=1 Tax=Streptomyces calidiresistens TaxID=1485586 RepID=A0A7W3T6G4_9ACTN|nr:RidA family protein [Streptomyces calidiresistens]MBB0231810.1 RidA family protein [Streptomyces calidiresistens]
MAVTLVNPEGLPTIDVYHQVSIATGTRMVFVAGQVSWDAEGTTVGEGDLTAQVERCYLNVATALAGAGASFDDVVKLNVHVVDWTPDRMPELLEGISRARGKLGITATPPATLLGVAALDVPEHLVEVEAVAIPN